MNNNNFIEVFKTLVKSNIYPTLQFDVAKDLFYIDLNTLAKSHLYLFENGDIEGRYNYKSSINLDIEIKCIITELCIEFSNSIHYRAYANNNWVKLCNENDIVVKLGDL